VRRAAQANWSRLPNHSRPHFYTAWVKRVGVTMSGVRPVYPQTSDIPGPVRHFAFVPRAVIAWMAMGECRDRTWFSHAPTEPAYGSLEALHDGHF
jgi:hypothetical protein